MKKIGGDRSPRSPAFRMYGVAFAPFFTIVAVQLHSPFQNVSVFTAFETFTGFPFPVVLSFIFSPSSDCRIERLEFPKLQSYSAYDIRLKFGHQNITDNVQSYNEYTYSMATCYMYIYMLTHFMGQI